MHVNEDGTVVVATGSPDIGGSRASMAIMAAETLGIDYDRVRPIVADYRVLRADARRLQDDRERRRQCMEKRMGTVRSSCACGMFAGNAGSGSARMIISMTSLSRSGWPELRAIWRAST